MMSLEIYLHEQQSKACDRFIKEPLSKLVSPASENTEDLILFFRGFYQLFEHVGESDREFGKHFAV